MSIFTKVTALFLISLALMLFIGREIEAINTEKLENELKEKYLQASRALFAELAVADTQSLRAGLAPLKLEMVDKALLGRRTFTTLFEQSGPLSALSFLKDDSGTYYLYLQYLDDSVLLRDYAHAEEGILGHYLTLLVLSDILLLVLIFVLILKMLFPLKRLSATMERFARGDFSARLDEKGRDEIATLSRTYNAMAGRLEQLIASRQRLLRDVGHELRTPVAKGKFAAELLEESPRKATIKRAFDHLDELIGELLHIERLNAEADTLHLERLDAESLIAEALSRLFVEDESSIEVHVDDNFTVEGDRYYLAIALKNLIDNALKYADALPVVIRAEERSISVASRGEALKEPLEYYLGEFTRDAEHQQHKGYGLGLNIVDSVLKRHGFGLLYEYAQDYNLFRIRF